MRAVRGTQYESLSALSDGVKRRQRDDVRDACDAGDEKPNQRNKTGRRNDARGDIAVRGERRRRNRCCSSLWDLSRCSRLRKMLSNVMSFRYAVHVPLPKQKPHAYCSTFTTRGKVSQKARQHVVRGRRRQGGVTPWHTLWCPLADLMATLSCQYISAGDCGPYSSLRSCKRIYTR